MNGAARRRCVFGWIGGDAFEHGIDTFAQRFVAGAAFVEQGMTITGFGIERIAQDAQQLFLALIHGGTPMR